MKYYLLTMLVTIITIRTQGQKDSSITSLNILEQFENVNHDAKWISLGGEYDYLNSIFGLIISNGYDEKPLIHFEDFSEDFIFKLKGLTDFSNSELLNISLGWDNSSKYFSLLSLNFDYICFQKSVFNHLNLESTMKIYIPIINIEFLAKIGYQQLNEFKDVGIGFGLEKHIHSTFYTGLSVGYYRNYFTYSLYGILFLENRIAIRIDYDRIESYSLISLGLSILIRR